MKEYSILKWVLQDLTQAGESLPEIATVNAKRIAFEQRTYQEYSHTRIELTEEETAALCEAAATYKEILERDIASLMSEGDYTLSVFGKAQAEALAGYDDDGDWLERVSAGKMLGSDRKAVAADLQYYILTQLLPTMQKLSR